MVIQDRAILQLNTQWVLKENDHSRLLKEINRENPSIKPDLISLSFAPIEVTNVNLSINENDQFIILEEAVSSGYPPYNTIFNISFIGDQVDKIIKPFHKNRGILFINYYVKRQVSKKIELSIKGSIIQSREDLSSSASLKECSIWIEQAIENKTLEFISSDDIKNLELTTIKNDILSLASQAVFSFIQSEELLNDKATISITEEKYITDSISFVLSTDIVDWFDNIDSTKLIKYL